MPPRGWWVANGQRTMRRRSPGVRIGGRRVADERPRAAGSSRRQRVRRERHVRASEPLERPVRSDVEQRRVDLALAGVERRADASGPAPRPPTMASASSVGTAASGSPPANASALRQPEPDAEPGERPGSDRDRQPLDVADAERRRAASTRSTRPGSDAMCERDVRLGVLGQDDARRAPRRRRRSRSRCRARGRVSGSALHEPMDVVVEHEHHQAERGAAARPAAPARDGAAAAAGRARPRRRRARDVRRRAPGSAAG